MCKYDRVAMGKRIRARRKNMGISQKDLAELIGISDNHMSSIEKGANNTTLDVLIRLCEVLKTTPDFFLLGNMRTNNIPQNIYENLLLCTEVDVKLVDHIVKYMAVENQDEYSKKYI